MNVIIYINGNKSMVVACRDQEVLFCGTGNECILWAARENYKVVRTEK